MRRPARHDQVARIRVGHNLRVGRFGGVALVPVGVKLRHNRLQPLHLGGIAHLDQLDRTLNGFPGLIHEGQQRLDPLGQALRCLHEQRLPIHRRRQNKFAARLRRRQFAAENLAQHRHRLCRLDVRQLQRLALPYRALGYTGLESFD